MAYVALHLQAMTGGGGAEARALKMVRPTCVARWALHAGPKTVVPELRFEWCASCDF